ncbi:Transcriptional regulator PerR [Fundidesulfovibrio magnetotacticus]|uniref:Transcriptional regulator PerR n=1 Tax=Fundidesulfovibrio magnetotacticus TaxID=2730080 RepID=A0A6V8LSK2_9BACT|nr:transcriptional repressor [Fundidesulfovibrio magnetotacticus]GFK92766.1 Transcriptional regulator PerR [Fundidesulfovibrio magnetotacticus]
MLQTQSTVMDFDSALERFKSISLDKGLRLTHQRLEILRELVGAKDHPSAEMVFGRVRRRLPTISLDTVYRTLSTFDELGLIMRVPVTGDQGRFDADTSPHHHFVCSRCKAIYDFFWDEFDRLTLPLDSEALGRADDRRVVLRGVCTRCMGEQ